jgi:hypothetical protein
MKKFFRFRSEHIKDMIRIQSLVAYNTLDFIDNKSILIANNQFIIQSGSKVCDLLPFNDSSNFAISERLKKTLEQNNITGWGCFPILISGVKENYYGFQNFSKAGPILNLQALNSYEAEFIQFDIGTWDGSDIFHLEDTAINVIVPKVKMILEAGGFSNLEILPL